MKNKTKKPNSPQKSENISREISNIERKSTIVNEQSPQQIGLQIEAVKWGLTFLFTIICTSIVAKLVSSFYKPDIKASMDLAKKLLIDPRIALPEPQEKLMVVAVILASTLSIFVFYGFFKSFFEKNIALKNTKIIYWAITTVLVLGMVFMIYEALLAPNPFANVPNIPNAHDLVAKTNFQFYFIKTFLYDHPVIFICIIFPIFFLILTFFNQSIEGKIARYFSMCLALILIGIAFLISTFDFPYTFENKYDFNAVYYSTLQVYHGSPLLVDNFTNTYGLYPHFIVPFLKLFGLSFFSFSFIMAALLVVCFLSLYYFLAKNISNKLILLFGFTSIFFNSYMYMRIVLPFNAVFSSVPIRWLFPCLLLAYSGFYFSDSKWLKAGFFQKRLPLLEKFNINSLKLLSFFIFSFGILWSPDTGTFTLLSLIAFYSFQEIDIKNLKLSIFKIILHLISAVIIAVLVLLLYSAIIKVFYGNTPDLILMFSTINVFSNLGFGMLPMPTTWHPFLLVGVVYILGIIYSVRAIYQQKINAKTTSVFLATAVGILLFLYYQGRSHNWNLFSINFPFFILLSIFADDLLKIIRSQKLLYVPFALSLLIISFSSIQILFSLNRLTPLISHKKDKLLFLSQTEIIQNNAKMIDDLTEENEKIAILSSVENQSLYHSLTKTSSSINPGFIDLFTKSSFDLVISQLINQDQKVFVDPQLFRFGSPALLTALSSYYELKKETSQENNVWWYFEKRKENIQGKPILKENDGAEVHETFYKNFKNQLKWSRGETKPLNLNGSNFSIEVIFKPKAYADISFAIETTVLSNADEEKGFFIIKPPGNKQFVFGKETTGVLLPVIENSYNYVAIQVNNNLAKAYCNGSLVGNMDLNGGYQNSNQPLFIGNKFARESYFFGDIYEIKVKNGSLSESEIKQINELVKGIK
jgi:hypothetical protein